MERVNQDAEKKSQCQYDKVGLINLPKLFNRRHRKKSFGDLRS